MSFQYQAGPRSSYRLISCSVKGTVLLNGSGSLSSGVDDDRGAVRSMTSTEALRIASARALSTDMRAPVPVCGRRAGRGWGSGAGPAVLSPAHPGRESRPGTACGDDAPGSQAGDGGDHLAADDLQRG